ncbi:MAG: outer membrane beta-barrel protein [Candidatus Zixiibacteriota bacterium]|nr:MAG: outer membrane beta-barrel protein [candidate division Zixibacteria bacterium]
MKFAGVLSTTALIVLLTVSSYAFDYERKGFVIGVGAGFTPLMTGSSDEGTLEFDRKSGYAVDFITGYAWNDRNMVLFLVNAGVYEDTLNVYFYGALIHQNEIQCTQGFNGVVYRHYLLPDAPSFYLTAGLGLQLWIANERFSCHKGPGFLLGAGYEFVKHFQISGSYSFGLTHNCYDDEYRHSQIVFTITGLLY